jgi:hypothetical protein
MLADRINAGNLQTEGTAGKIRRGSQGEKRGTPIAGIPHLHTQQGDGQKAQRALLLHREFFFRKGIA